MTTLYTGKVTVRSGRDGYVRSDDGKLDVRLAFPEAMGGDGQGTNPEQLFGAGYAACFGSTLGLLARAEGKTLVEVEVQAEVDMLKEGEQYDLGVRLTVRARGADRPTLEALVEKARHACPYARATRDRLATTIRVEA